LPVAPLLAGRAPAAGHTLPEGIQGASSTRR
jgi:hypothetical protein